MLNTFSYLLAIWISSFHEVLCPFLKKLSNPFLFLIKFCHIYFIHIYTSIFQNQMIKYHFLVCWLAFLLNKQKFIKWNASSPPFLDKSTLMTQKLVLHLLMNILDCQRYNLDLNIWKFQRLYYLLYDIWCLTDILSYKNKEHF